MMWVLDRGKATWSPRTQRWEHCTADLTLSTSEVTSVWYSIWALEASSFASVGQRKKQPTGKESMRRFWLQQRNPLSCPRRRKGRQGRARS